MARPSSSVLSIEEKKVVRSENKELRETKRDMKSQQAVLRAGIRAETKELNRLQREIDKIDKKLAKNTEAITRKAKAT